MLSPPPHWVDGRALSQGNLPPPLHPRPAEAAATASAPRHSPPSPGIACRITPFLRATRSSLDLPPVLMAVSLSSRATLGCAVARKGLGRTAGVASRAHVIAKIGNGPVSPRSVIPSDRPSSGRESGPRARGSWSLFCVPTFSCTETCPPGPLPLLYPPGRGTEMPLIPIP